MVKHDPVIDVIDDGMAEILRSKSGLDRLAIADDMYRSARGLIERSVRDLHADWDDRQIAAEVARRIAGASH